MSLLEVMISFTLFVTVMVLLCSVWVTHARALELAQDQEVAANLCQMKMEETLDQGYVGASYPSSPFVIERTLRGLNYQTTFYYQIQVTKEVDPTVPPPAHTDVIVNVTYESATGNHTIQMESYATW